MAKLVLGIGGKKRAGKSTLAHEIYVAVAIRGLTFEEVSFAQPIKEMLRELFSSEVPYSTFTDDARKQDKIEVAPGSFMTVRELLQKVGTDCFRDIIHQDFWVARGIGKIKSSSADIVVIPDIRFENELNVINELGMSIYVEKLTKKILPIDTHPSEMELNGMIDNFDMQVVAEEGDLEILVNLAYGIIKDI